MRSRHQTNGMCNMRKIAIFAPNNVRLLDLTIAAELFGRTRTIDGPAYQISFCSQAEEVTAGDGHLAIRVESRLDALAAAHTIIVVAAQAADLPTRKAAPVQYVRVCDAYGAGFFYIPGSDTCLRVGGFVLAQLGIQPDSARYSVRVPIGSPIAALTFGGAASGLAGFLPAAAAYASNNGRDIFGFSATGRIELDARTQSPFGTVRSFVRLDANFGAGANYGQTGSLASSIGINSFNLTAGPTINRELVFLNKGFIQFAGITAGRVQSFFDFYADAINYAGLWGSNSTVWAAAYTYTAGGGWSITASMEDPVSRRGPINSVINVGNVAGIAPGAATAFGAQGNVAAGLGRVVMPEIVANVRWDQPWGAVQVSGAIHNVQAHLYPATAAVISAAQTTYAQPVVSASKIGFAVQAGLQFNMDMVAPGDKLWLQATYARGSIGYVQGNNLAFVGGLNGTAAYGVGIARSSNGPGWATTTESDCVFNYTGGCDMSKAFNVLAAYKHYWTPTISSGVFGGFYQVTYSSASNTPVNPFALTGAVAGGSLFTSGVNNFRNLRIGTNLVWTPIKNFDIGAEITYARYMSAWSAP